LVLVKSLHIDEVDIMDLVLEIFDTLKMPLTFRNHCRLKQEKMLRRAREVMAEFGPQ
jgi:hypothetical protein